MSARRVVLRRAWVSEHPPHFNVEAKKRAAAAVGGRLRPRLSFSLWMIKTFEPARWAELVARASKKGDDAEDVDPAAVRGITTTEPPHSIRDALEWTKAEDAASGFPIIDAPAA